MNMTEDSEKGIRKEKLKAGSLVTLSIVLAKFENSLILISLFRSMKGWQGEKNALSLEFSLFFLFQCGVVTYNHQQRQQKSF